MFLHLLVRQHHCTMYIHRSYPLCPALSRFCLKDIILKLWHHKFQKISSPQAYPWFSSESLPSIHIISFLSTKWNLMFLLFMLSKANSLWSFKLSHANLVVTSFTLDKFSLSSQPVIPPDETNILLSAFSHTTGLLRCFLMEFSKIVNKTVSVLNHPSQVERNHHT